MKQKIFTKQNIEKAGCFFAGVGAGYLASKFNPIKVPVNTANDKNEDETNNDTVSSSGKNGALREQLFKR